MDKASPVSTPRVTRGDSNKPASASEDRLSPASKDAPMVRTHAPSNAPRPGMPAPGYSATTPYPASSRAPRHPSTTPPAATSTMSTVSDEATSRPAIRIFKVTLEAEDVATIPDGISFGFRHDITTKNVDAILNAAKKGLIGSSGVAKAIQVAGGQEFVANLEKTKKFSGGEIDSGEAVTTRAGGNLQAKYVISAVGPHAILNWKLLPPGEKTEKEEKLRAAYDSAFAQAAQHGVKSFVLVPLSTDKFRFDKKLGAAIMVEKASEAMRKNPDLNIQIVTYDPKIKPHIETELMKLQTWTTAQSAGGKPAPSSQ